MTQKGESIIRFLICIITVSTVFFACIAAAAEKPLKGETVLQDVYDKNVSRLETNSFGLPLFLESYERDNRVHVDVYGIFTYPFSAVANVLKVPANWCDIVSLHPNVKACTYVDTLGGVELLTFYVGSKFYQLPEDTRKVIYRYRKVDLQERYMDILLNADEGPFGTENHRMRFEALKLDGGKTFVHVSYEYSDSVALRLAVKAYFATVGRGKVGFTITGTDKQGRAVFIGGPRGAVERNAARYYFAIQSFMNSLHYPEKSRFGMRINEWYDLTSRYRKQLFDLEKRDYIIFKTTEHENQEMLQSR